MNADKDLEGEDLGDKTQNPNGSRASADIDNEDIEMGERGDDATDGDDLKTGLVSPADQEKSNRSSFAPSDDKDGIASQDLKAHDANTSTVTEKVNYGSTKTGFKQMKVMSLKDKLGVTARASQEGELCSAL